MVWGEPCTGFMPPQGWVSVPLGIIAGFGQFRNEKRCLHRRGSSSVGGISESRYIAQTKTLDPISVSS